MQPHQGRPATFRLRLTARVLARCGAIIALAALVIVPSAPKPRAGAYEQLQQMGGSGGGVPPVSAPKCIRHCGSGSDSGSDGGSGDNSEDRQRGGLFNLLNNWSQRFQAEAAQQAKERRAEAHRQNEQGVAAYKQGDYAKALRLFRQAAENNPDDPVIRQNVKNAEAQVARIKREKKAREEARLKELAVNRYMKILATLLPPPRSETGPDAARRAAEPAVPLPGFKPAQWHEYLQARDTVARLEAKLNRNNGLSNADGQIFYAALQRRNALWAQAMDQPLNATVREWLSLPVAVVDSRVRQAATNAASKITWGDGATVMAYSGEAPKTFNIEAELLKANQYVKDTADKVNSKLQHAGNLISKGSISLLPKKDDSSSDVATAISLGVSNAPGRVTDRVKMVKKGGNIVSKVAYRSWNNFRKEVTQITGGTYDPKAADKELDKDMDKNKKAREKWIKEGE